MKKLFIAVGVFFGLTTVNAQSKGAVEFGVNVGYNFSTIGTDDGDFDTGEGFNVGFAADYFFNSSWSLKGKLIYDQKGYDNDYITDGTNDYPTDININYLTVPVMANWHFGKKKNWYLNFGPYVGFLLSAKDTALDTDLKYAFKSTDFGISYGVGVKIPVSNQAKISIELEEADGLSNVLKGTSYDTRNKRGSINVGVNFLLK
ncbi:MAG: porin family protein [Flavobacterium sp.]|nr:porin family protein [Flavobacterium sp.]